jgi:hypothetical protein
MENLKRPVVVVVGAGFGGLNAVKTLYNAPVDVVLVDRNYYPLFQPLLYQVTTAGFLRVISHIRYGHFSGDSQISTSGWPRLSRSIWQPGSCILQVEYFKLHPY